MTEVNSFPTDNWQFLKGGGEMGQLTRLFDWEQTVLGSPSQWPQSLKTTLSIMLNSRFPMFLWWGPELICFYNDAYRPSLGQDGKHPAILGMPAAEAWPEIWDVIKPLIDQVLSGGEATWSEDQLIPIYRNGRMEDVYWTFSYSPVNDETGIPAGILVICNESTNRVQDENKKAMLAAIIESSEDAIISKTLKGMITSWNQAAEKLFGYTESEALGKHISMVIPADRMKEEELIIKKITSNERLEHFETIRITKSGNEIPISLTVSPIRNSKGQTIGASKIVRDISKQKIAEERLVAIALDNARLYEEIKVLNAKKDEFIGLASHELKTPVTSVNAYLQIIERNLSPDDRNKAFITKALQQVNKLTSLISDLLDVSKIQTGKLPFTYITFDLGQALTEVVEMMQHSYTSHKIEFYFDQQPDLLQADQQRIEQVVINLVTNAIKYSPGANRVILNATVSGEKVIVSVQDFGIGIARDQQERIFSRFYRVENLAAHMSGLGIGLYISHEIISRHEGSLWVESNPGEGSIFYFELPINYNSL